MEALHLTTLLYILCVCLFSWALVAAAEPNCNAPPLALAIRNVTLANGFTKRGVEVSVGSQQEKFALSMNMAYNNTVLKLGPGFCPESETTPGCTTRKGGIFDPTESSTWKNGTLETFGGGDDTRRADRGIKLPAWRYGQDNLSLNDTSNSEIELKGFPVTVLDDEDLTKSTLGLAPNSTMVKKLYEKGHIPSQAFSVYWGQTGTAKNTFNDGTLVLGGIDRAKLANPDAGFYEEEFGHGEDEFNTCYLRVRVEQMVLRHPDGREWNLIQQRSQSGMLMCVVLDYELITVPADIALAYLDATGDSYLGREPGEYLWGMRILGENAFPGTLTVKLTNGFSAEIPNHQLIHPARAISDEGEMYISNNTVKVVRLNALEGMNAPDLPLLGAPFLSQTYLVVDHDNHVMKFAHAKPSSEQDLESIISEKNSTQCSKTTDTPVPTVKPSTTKKPQEPGTGDETSSTPQPEQSPQPKLSVILGGVAGVICLTGVILVSVLFFIKRHRRKQQMHQQAIGLSNPRSHPPVMQHDDASGLQLNEDPTFHVLPGPYNHQLSYNSSSISETPSQGMAAELYGQSHYGSQTQVYAELDANTRASLYAGRFKK